MSREDERHLSTADLVDAGDRRSHDLGTQADPHMQMNEAMQVETRKRTDPASIQAMPHEEHLRHEGGHMPGATAHHAMQGEALAALFHGDVAEDFRHRWDAIQIGFVDDPRAAVRNADELVAQVMKSLAETFAQQRSEIEARIGHSDSADTENLRVALQRYRSFFQRLLSL